MVPYGTLKFELSSHYFIQLIEYNLAVILLPVP